MGGGVLFGLMAYPPCADASHAVSPETRNYLKNMIFCRNSYFVFDKPTSFFFMVGGLWAAIRGVPGNPIL